MFGNGLLIIPGLGPLPAFEKYPAGFVQVFGSYRTDLRSVMGDVRIRLQSQHARCGGVFAEGMSSLRRSERDDHQSPERSRLPVARSGYRRAPRTAARAIAQEAYRRGSPDNLTVQVLRIDELPARAANELQQQYANEVPVVFIDGRKAFKYRMDGNDFLRALAARE